MCLYSYHALFILLQKSEEYVTERNKRLNLWSRLIDWWNHFLILANWIIENDFWKCQIICMHGSWIFYQTEWKNLQLWKLQEKKSIVNNGTIFFQIWDYAMEWRHHKKKKKKRINKVFKLASVKSVKTACVCIVFLFHYLKEKQNF